MFFSGDVYLMFKYWKTWNITIKILKKEIKNYIEGKNYNLRKEKCNKLINKFSYQGNISKMFRNCRIEQDHIEVER